MSNNSNLRKEISDKIVNFLPQLNKIHLGFDDVTEKNNFIIKLGELVDYIDNLFESYDFSSLNEILGGEFSKKDSADLPLFVYIDLFSTVNQFFLNKSQGYAYKDKINKNAKIVKEKLEKLRKKVSELSCSEKFNKDYTLSEEVVWRIVSAQGFFTINFEKKEEKDYLIIRSRSVGVLRRDDPRYIDIYRNKEEDTFLFAEEKKEYDYISSQKKEKEFQEFNEIFNNETKEYFKDGKLPAQFEDWPLVLIGRNEMDLRFKSFLTSALEEYLKCVRQHCVTDELKEKFYRFLEAKDEIAAKKRKEEQKKIEEERKKKIEEEKQKQEEERKKQIEEEQKKKSENKSSKSFSSFLKKLKGSKKEQKPSEPSKPSESVKTFEEERKKQLIIDEQGRKYVVSEVVMIDGKEVYVPINSDEVRVVRK